MNPHQRCLQAKVKYRNEPKQVMPKSEDLSRSLEIYAIWTFDTEFPTIFNKSCTYITFKSAVKHRQLGYGYPRGQTVHLEEATTPGPDPGRCKCIGQKKLPMHSSVRFLPQIMKNNTFCENTRLKMHKFQQSYFFQIYLKNLFFK